MISETDAFAEGLVRDVYWVPAVFIGAAVAGVVWAFVARHTIFEREPALTAGQAWLAIGVGCVVLLVVGLVLALLPWARVLRTVGVALVVVAVSGGSVLLVWGTPFVIAVQRQ